MIAFHHNLSYMVTSHHIKTKCFWWFMIFTLNNQKRISDLPASVFCHTLNCNIWWKSVIWWKGIIWWRRFIWWRRIMKDTFKCKSVRWKTRSLILGWCSRQSRDKWQMVSCNRRTPSSFPVGTHRLHHAWCSLSRCTATWRQSMAKGKTSVNKCGRESSHFEIDRTVRRQGGDPPLQLSGSLPPAVWTCNSWHSPLATLWNFINTQATRVEWRIQWLFVSLWHCW